MSIRLIVANNQPIFCDGLKKHLGRARDFELVASCANAEEALSAARQYRPDILLIDYLMPAINGSEVLHAINREKLPVRVVFMATALEDYHVVGAVGLGVAGLFLKTSSAQTLLQCLRTVYTGGTWFEPGPVSNALERAANGQVSRQDLRAGSLSKREVEVVQLLNQGLRNAEIAKRLFISPGTAKIHLHNIYKKLGVKGRVALSAYARMQSA